jgi:hypothetical protein
MFVGYFLGKFRVPPLGGYRNQTESQIKFFKDTVLLLTF